MSIKPLSLALLAAFTLTGSGCASTVMMSHEIGSHAAMPYAGTILDAELATGGSLPEGGSRHFSWLLPLAALDFPLTLALDTAAIPVILPLYLLGHHR